MICRGSCLALTLCLSTAWLFAIFASQVAQHNSQQIEFEFCKPVIVQLTFTKVMTLLEFHELSSMDGSILAGCLQGVSRKGGLLQAELVSWYVIAVLYWMGFV